MPVISRCHDSSVQDLARIHGLFLLLTETPTRIASHHLFLPFSVVLDRVGVCGASVCIWRVDCVLLGVYRFHEVLQGSA